MKITQHSTTALFFTAITAAASLGFTVAQEFQKIADVPQTVNSVQAAVECSADSTPLPMWTIEVADSVTVSTSPPNLVTVRDDRGTMKFRFNYDVANTANETGIKIGFPADQLESLDAYSSAMLQISGAFSSVSNLDVYGNTMVRADLSSNTVPLNVNLYGDSTLILKSGSNLKKGAVYGGSILNVATPSFNSDVYGNAVVNVDGNMNSVTAYGNSELTATGDLSGKVTIYGGSTINAASCGGEIDSYGGGKCVSGTQTVVVSIETQPTVMAATRKGTCPDSGSTLVYSCRASITAIAMVAAYMVM